MSGGQADGIGPFIERFAASLADAGMPRLPARVFAALLVSDTGRMTAAELAETLQVSAGGISGAVGYLVRLQMIRTERDPGSRRHVYVADGSWYESLVSANPFLATGEGTLREGVALLGDTPAGERIAETLELVQFLKEESDAMLRRWRERRQRRHR